MIEMGKKRRGKDFRSHDKGKTTTYMGKNIEIDGEEQCLGWR